MDLRDLYQEVILDHSRSPRNKRVPEGANRTSEGHNPLCGDEVRIHALVEDGRIKDIGFDGSGCAISTAATSTMTEAVKGLSVHDSMKLFDCFHSVVTGKNAFPDLDILGKLGVFTGVSEYPMRVKCATLPWHTLRAALENPSQKVTTE
jgi:nitrogen fixation NifU-like protein